MSNYGLEHRRGRGRFGRSRPKCSYCHKLRHTREMCYSLHGRPPKNFLYLKKNIMSYFSIEQVSRHLHKQPQLLRLILLLLDRSTGQTIGTGRESEGLYYLNSLSPSTTCLVTDPPDLIHRRLRHSSLSKLQKMVPSLSSLSTLYCESCQLGKHTRASFRVVLRVMQSLPSP
nr:uncharacterized protein LOC117273943 [Nicotiana tomentosiformis]